MPVERESIVITMKKVVTSLKQAHFRRLMRSLLAFVKTAAAVIGGILGSKAAKASQVDDSLPTSEARLTQHTDSHGCLQQDNKTIINTSGIAACRHQMESA
ncbi:uncharacterized protein CLUP02_06580 [Colletotrichum lupini]|uniref:Uncharacterized protein n=1 Tax=Colletotrichum lupini TaxID=145971 RepID=A0A9Q8SPC8_9PEZI|nr:uncharacterized protein CLUP02_06580 [Colletotrichum lupini]UQC81094.1 hypothetical protein CLUP02_06580 [Colletotrichum lupini]